ncbi:MAG: HAD family phosphatase [Alphaproteobacteria bacterium]|nr:HAD family phosphatase [Alphaproteobacteria bacterium]
MMRRAFFLIIELECILAIKLIIFDFDGVLVDSEFIAGQVMTKQLNELGIDINLARILQLFVGLDDIAKRLLLTDYIGASEVEGFILETKRLSRMAYMKQLKPLPFVESMLENLPIAKCIASNSHPDSLKIKIKASKLDRFFSEDKLYFGAMVAKPKPAPDLYLHAADMHKVDADECLVIEDSVHGVRAAVAANMPVIGYYGASHCFNGYEVNLEKAGANTSFNDMRELLTIIGKM